MPSLVLKTIKDMLTHAAELRTLLDTDAQEAIRRAHALKSVPEIDPSVRLLKAGILIDAGAITRQIDVVKEGVDLLRQLHAADPGQHQCQYNLANGLSALADLDKTLLPASMRSLRQEARKLWHDVSKFGQGDLPTQALTNLGNALSKSHRWSEAYDAYVKALNFDHSNGVAAGQAARLLLSGVCAGLGNPTKMRQVAARYAAIAKAHRERVVEFAGTDASDTFERLAGSEESLAYKGDPPIKDAYLRFVAQHHLALVPTIEGLDVSLRRWDSLRICSFREDVDTGPEAPPLYAMFNSIKAGYLAARKLAFQPERSPDGDTGLYSDTVDYAMYGTSTAMLLLAQRAALDVLDQIAVALNDYLKVGIDPEDVYFSNFWRVDKKKPQRHAALDQEIADGNKALIALGEVAEDFSLGGYLHRKKTGTKRINSSLHGSSRHDGFFPTKPRYRTPRF